VGEKFAGKRRAAWNLNREAREIKGKKKRNRRRKWDGSVDELCQIYSSSSI
jgi:hypothetical protein